jgi:glycosyltransferase involved in cell wall biosynthesis
MPAGVDTGTFIPNETIDVQPNTLFHLGSLDWQPNIEAVLYFIEKILPQIQSERPEIEFHVAGKNTPDVIKQYHNPPHIIVHGEVEHAPTFMQTYDIMVVPLLSGGGMRLKMVEAMALGKPIVTTSVGIEGIPAKHETHAVIADTDKAFAKAVLQLMDNTSKKNALGTEAQIFVQRYFNWDSIIQDVTTLYSSLLENHS